MRVLIAIALLGCHGNDAPAPRRRNVDATMFRHLLAEHEIATIAITPVGRNTARYLLHDMHGRDSEVDAEYPGTLVEAISASKVPSTLAAPATVEDWPQSYPAMDEITADTLQSRLASKDTARDIEAMFVEPLADGTARYRVVWKTKSKQTVAIAPFPGPVVDAMFAAEIPYGVRLPSD
jgi:hypothetical protein